VKLFPGAVRCFLAVHPSQPLSERKFSGAGKTLSGEQGAEREAQLPLVAAWWNIYLLLPPRPYEYGGSQARARGVIGQSPVVVGSGYRVVVRGCDKTYNAIKKLLMTTAGCCVTVRWVW
jgi:hypothetical protein